ncbi:Sec-independent protein translocase protein TatB [Alterisphingorhabdus coralli]|uniref:Sec-independent protein translocase protein TatB n=1 Tax=Alterisphingorhabdus coralli TaxID=3071408 RepID=A0AA97F6Z4_9SPHN|nr:Sec-independent protein translocase protein TatB [Parasphingorhabdus sp. SCSIO 66989]WOE74601.1 Sec-independent protein translocase protein TatB [Parasphingorhabdus sp. SCSIO 66989]
MFDIGWTEFLTIIIIAIVVIGPKDLPLAIRTAGRWMARGRRLMGQFRASIDSLAHEAEMEEMEKRWAEQNERIMREHGDAAPMLPGVTGYADNGGEADAGASEASAQPTPKTDTAPTKTATVKSGGEDAPS